MWLLYVFIVSICLAVFLFILKGLENKRQKKFMVGRFLSRGDAFVIRFANFMERHLHYRREKTFFFFLVHLPDRAEKFFSGLKTKTSGRYLDINAKMRGKRNLSQGTASPYMRSMISRSDEDNEVV